LFIKSPGDVVFVPKIPLTLSHKGRGDFFLLSPSHQGRGNLLPLPWWERFTRLWRRRRRPGARVRGCGFTYELLSNEAKLNKVKESFIVE